jgi:glycosyltransferase involved in cell wall biosynthesis
MTLWIDVEDLLEYARVSSRPSGIQRLSFEIYSALVDIPGASIRFVRHDPATGGFRTVAWDDLRLAYDRMVQIPLQANTATAPASPSAMPKRRRWTTRIPPEMRNPLGRAARAQAAAITGLGQALRVMPTVLRRHSVAWLGDGTLDGVPLETVAKPGDVLCAFGAPWIDEGPAMVERAKRELGLGFAMLVYDLIPVLKTEYASPFVMKQYEVWHRKCLPMADRIFAISVSTARDLERWARQVSVPLSHPVVPIPIGTGFPHAAEADATLRPLPPDGNYVLFVSTIEARKNHALAFRVWRRLTQEMPIDQVPTLVFAGRIGWMVSDLLQQIRNSGDLDGKLQLFQDPTDAELAALYAGCRFTIFPSHYEGWGLPVTEALGFGKTCLAARTSSLPEAGGPFCLYFDPDNATEATALVRRAIEEKGLIAGLEERIRNEFRPVSWTETAQALLDQLEPPEEHLQEAAHEPAAS